MAPPAGTFVMYAGPRSSPTLKVSRLKGRLPEGGIRPMAKATPQKIGRDARSGQFIPVREAQRRPSTTVIETIKKGR